MRVRFDSFSFLFWLTKSVPNCGRLINSRAVYLMMTRHTLQTSFLFFFYKYFPRAEADADADVRFVFVSFSHVLVKYLVPFVCCLLFLRVSVCSSLSLSSNKLFVSHSHTHFDFFFFSIIVNSWPGYCPR